LSPHKVAKVSLVSVKRLLQKVCRKLTLAPDNAEMPPAKLAFVTRADAGCGAFAGCSASCRPSLLGH
jgi:hypothetical protein